MPVTDQTGNSQKTVNSPLAFMDELCGFLHEYIFIHCREQLRSWHLQSYKIAHVGDGEFRQVPTVTLARRNTVLFYQHTIQACHLSCFCVSWFVGLYTMIIWNIGMWNLRNMIVTYKPDITDVTFVTVEYDYNCRCKYGRNCQRSTINI